MTAPIFLVDGFEETEALVTADILVRGGVDAPLVSLTGRELAEGSHRISVKTDLMFGDTAGKTDGWDMIVLPGGPGTEDYKEHTEFMAFVKEWCGSGKLTAAICAAPTVLGRLGLLDGRRAVCYPGLESGLAGAEIAEGDVVTDGNIITSKGPATVMAFGFALVEALMGKETADEVKKKFLYK